MKMNNYHPLRYVLITPARNEETHIEKTIQSVISQSVAPTKWIIVSDGSSDHTDEIVQMYTNVYQWMDFLRLPEHETRQFASKVFAFNAGYRRTQELDFNIIGNLDADVSFEKDYIEYLLDKFVQYPEIGVAGTPFVEEITTQYDYNYTNIEHVSGACQLFRRQCFDAIGGYRPIKGGGIDWVAVTTARMKGWKTRTFTERLLFHHRKMGTGKGNILTAQYRLGQQDYYLGNHPFWEVLRILYQMRFKPYIIRGILILAGYALAAIKRTERPVPIELVKFIRKEQKERLAVRFGLSRK